MSEENKAVNNFVALDFKALQSLILKDLTKQQQTQLLRKYSREQIKGYIEAPDRNEKQLREASQMLYNISSHYKRLVNYFAKLPTYGYILEPVNIDLDKVNEKSLKNQYQKIVQFLDTMNIKHEFQKIVTYAFRDDVFYGYEWVTKDDYFFQRLNPEFCQLSSIESGVYNYAFDFTFFDKNPDKLLTYPPEFKKLYNKYLNKSAGRWQELDSNFTICIKINEEVEAVIPPFAGVFEALYELEDFKTLRKNKTQISNYKVLIQKIPLRSGNDTSVNDFAIDFGSVTAFHNRAVQALPEDGVGLITTPMEVTDISFDRDSSDNDRVEQAERDIYDILGVSKLLFNGNSNTSVGLDKSIRTDEQIAFGVLRQIERWINRRIRKEITNSMFRINLLNLTIFNTIDMFDSYITAAQYGLPTKSMACAALGLSPSAVMNLTYLENTFLDMPNKFIPLSSSHTAIGSTAGATPTKSNGRPQKNGDSLSASGVTTRDNGNNANKAGK